MLDRLDRHILDCLQRDAGMSVADIADRVGLTKNPCWRRIQKLDAQGYIRQRVALLDRRQLNLGVTAFVNIRTSHHTSDWLERFARVVDDIPEVVEFYRMSGDVDYMLKIVVPTIEAYDLVYKRMIKNIEIYDVSSHFAMEELKCTTALPLDYAGS